MKPRVFKSRFDKGDNLWIVSYYRCLPGYFKTWTEAMVYACAIRAMLP